MLSHINVLLLFVIKVISVINNNNNLKKNNLYVKMLPLIHCIKENFGFF